MKRVGKKISFFSPTKLDRFTIHKLSIVLDHISGRHLKNDPLRTTTSSPKLVDVDRGEGVVEPVLILLNSPVTVVNEKPKKQKFTTAPKKRRHNNNNNNNNDNNILSMDL